MDTPSDSYDTPRWSSRRAFVFAAAGLAIGLGDIWKFPLLVEQGGGGAFILLYMGCLLVIGMPLLMAEIALGRHGGHSPITGMRLLTAGKQASPLWQYLGMLLTLSAVLILSYYSVIGGWILAYAVRAGAGVFQAVDTAAGIRTTFTQFIADPEKLLAWHTIFMVMTVCINGARFRQGVESALKLLVPAIFVLLLLLLSYAIAIGAFNRGVEVLLQSDFSELTPEYIMEAIGRAFFSLGLAVGGMMVYGAYLSKSTSVAYVSFLVVIIDILVAVLAGLVVYSIVFAVGVEPAAGVTLVFEAMPIAFGKLKEGVYFGALFFVLLLLVAWTSAIALLEPVVAWLTEKYGWSRARSATAAGLVIWAIGTVNLLSFNLWAFKFNFLGDEKTNGVFDILDIATSKMLVPISAILIAVFAGWIMTREQSITAIRLRAGLVYFIWSPLIRLVVPISIAAASIYFFFVPS